MFYKPQLILIATSLVSCGVWACSRQPHGTTAEQSPVDENFVVYVAGNPDTYVPGNKYNVSLVANNGLSFISFNLVLEREDGDDDIRSLGTFEISDLAETRFSPRCPNLVENTNTNVKTRVDATWVAPAETGKGCILIRATVVQHRDVWYMNDGMLTKQMCEEEIDDVDSQPAFTNPCCACDEAKYELTFEGKWSRHTHPKDFPANSWRTRFSDIIGASHTINYRFWDYGKLASDGLREVAEHGSTRTLETELKDNSDQIRTIIKARGISYPNVTGKTFAVFRVDQQHHLISLVSMIDPSPDWIVGVSGLELCLPNCTWVENKVHNLYPWDAGTDSGPSYMSADQPQKPADVIRRIKSNFPNDPRSPFYDPTGAPMKPLATLHINRRRLYEKTCVGQDNENEPMECATTHWSQWDECSARCGPGKQYRKREFKNPTMARRFKCSTNLREDQECTGTRCGGINMDGQGGGHGEDGEYVQSAAENAECALSDWSEWSTCSVTCGSGTIVRTRHYMNPRAKKKCQRVNKAKLQQTRSCEGVVCGGEIGGENGEAAENRGAMENEAQEFDSPTFINADQDIVPFSQFESYSQKRDDFIPPECGVSHWSDFSPCLGPCGSVGQRHRQRQVWNNNEVYGVKPPHPRHPDVDPCGHIKRMETVNCTNPDCDTIVPPYCYEQLSVSPCRDSNVANYWFYDYMSDQCALFWADKCDRNRNKFPSKEVCEETCQLPRRKNDMLRRSLDADLVPQNCIVSEWHTHSCNATCGEGVQIKTRRVLQTPKYGGRPCPKHLVRLEKCHQRCDEMYSVDDTGLTFIDRRVHAQPQNKPKKEVDLCRYSDWSAWTPCTASCGDNSVRQKTRTLLNNELSYKCKDRVRIEKCSMLPCEFNDN